MTRAAVLLVALALIAAGVWLGFGERLTSPPAAAATPAAAAADPSAADAPAKEEAEPAADGYRPVEPLVAEPVQAFDAPEQTLDPELDYRAVFDTTAGRFTIELYDDRAPITVNNFVFLALHRYYEGVPFHRVLDDFMAQTGDPTGTGNGGPGYEFGDEIVPELRHDRPGVLSMANAGPDTNGSQFFVTFEATPWLDDRHAVFGAVIEGIETLDSLTRIDPQTPAAVAALSDPASVLADQGVDDAAGHEGDVESWLTERLGSLPAPGQKVPLAGQDATLGSVAGEPAIALFPTPDRIETVTVLAAPGGGTSDPVDASDAPSNPNDQEATEP